MARIEYVVDATQRAKGAGKVALIELESIHWVVVKMMVPFWVPITIRHLLFRVPRKGP